MKNAVKPDYILAIEYLLKKEGSNLAVLRSKVMTHGSLDKLNAELDKQVKDLDILKHTLEYDVSLLERKKESLEKFLQDGFDNLQKATESATATVNDGKVKIKEMILEICKDIPATVNDVTAKIIAIGEQADFVVKQYAKTKGILVFEALIRAVNGEKVDVRQVRDATVFAMDILLALLPSTSRNRFGLEMVIKNLRDNFSIIFFS